MPNEYETRFAPCPRCGATVRIREHSISVWGDEIVKWVVDDVECNAGCRVTVGDVPSRQPA